MQETAAPAPTRTYWYPEREDITIYGLLAALSDPTRLGIVRAIAARDECCPFDFLDVTSKQNLTHHFKVLREAGLIMSRYEGRQNFRIAASRAARRHVPWTARRAAERRRGFRKERVAPNFLPLA